MAFLDEEEQIAAPQEPEPPPRRTAGPERKRQQFLVRRLIAVGVGVAFLILLVIGVRGCLEARSDRGLRNYSQSIGTIMAESEQRGKDFFEAIEDSSEIELQNRVSSLRGASESLLDRAENLDAPGQMRDAQSAATLALRLRRDGLGTISSSVTEAAADSETADAIESITSSMGAFYASDILWQQVASPEIATVLQEDGVEGVALPPGNFMPEDSGTQFLDQTEIATIFSGVSGGDAAGLQGLGLVSTMIGDTTLDPEATTNVPDDATEIAVQVQNQGESEANSIPITVTVEGTTLETTIESLAPGETDVARVTLNPLPQPGAEVAVEVFVEPVPGESVAENNEATYSVIYGTE